MLHALKQYLQYNDFCLHFIYFFKWNLMNKLRKWFKFSLISLFLLSGQLSVFDTPDINLSLSFPRSSHWNIKWSIVCSVVPHGHVGYSIILNLCGYDVTFPCPVVIVVNIGVTFIFIFSLSCITGKKSFVICPFVVLSHSLCHFIKLPSFNSLITVLFGIFL